MNPKSKIENLKLARPTAPSPERREGGGTGFHPDVGVVVPAAGEGRRLRLKMSKAFVPVASEPMIVHALRAIEGCASVGWIVVVVRPEDQERMRHLVRERGLRRVSDIVPGGSSRASSVANGVAALPAEARWVVSHDAARPCLQPWLVDAVIEATRRDGAVACGLPAAVTIKSVDRQQTVRLTLDREGLWLVQTPQGFRREWLVEALARVDGQLEQMPDDAAMCEWAGFPVRMIPGDALNIKVTLPEDLLIAEAILKSREYKTVECGM